MIALFFLFLFAAYCRARLLPGGTSSVHALYFGSTRVSFFLALSAPHFAVFFGFFFLPRTGGSTAGWKSAPVLLCHR
jgi:hypothetical protein